ncbi:MAG: NAD-dependent epimerase/dehydratase family protein [Chlorobi bacterium]|nr:NAD-dependent epimerase/dehydratase family protein [Chlorobiota bacterium]
MKKLIIGAYGQIGSELRVALEKRHGLHSVMAADIRKPESEDSDFVLLDATEKDSVFGLLESEEVDEVYLLAALLSAKAEQMPQQAWRINMQVLFNLLEAGKEGLFKKLFWPSSIAVFGPHTPKQHTPQYTVMDPDTVYGISKLAGERWMEYYFEKYGLDVRSLRYPGILSWKTAPGGGTTDYAVEMFHYALRHEPYVCYVAPGERLPMMYIDDAVEGTLQLMSAPAEKLRIRSSYNLSGIDFTPEELARAIRRYIPGFRVEYRPDFRQQIAATWPDSIDDRFAREDWGWRPRFDLDKMVREMLAGLKQTQYPEAELSL